MQTPKIEFTGYGLDKPKAEQKYLPYGNYSYRFSHRLFIFIYFFDGDIHIQPIFLHLVCVKSFLKQLFFNVYLF